MARLRGGSAWVPGTIWCIVGEISAQEVGFLGSQVGSGGLSKTRETGDNSGAIRRSWQYQGTTCFPHWVIARQPSRLEKNQDLLHKCHALRELREPPRDFAGAAPEFLPGSATAHVQRQYQPNSMNLKPAIGQCGAFAEMARARKAPFQISQFQRPARPTWDWHRASSIPRPGRCRLEARKQWAGWARPAQHAPAVSSAKAKNPRGPG